MYPAFGGGTRDQGGQRYVFFEAACQDRSGRRISCDNVFQGYGGGDLGTAWGYPKDPFAGKSLLSGPVRLFIGITIRASQDGKMPNFPINVFGGIPFPRLTGIPPRRFKPSVKAI